MRLEHQIKELNGEASRRATVRPGNTQANPRGYCGSMCVIAMTRAHLADSC